MKRANAVRTGMIALAMACAGAFVSAQSVGKTILMLHFDGSIKDECGNACTVSGNPSISKGNAKAGSGAVYFSNGSYIDVAGGLELGTSDWTIDWWEYRTVASARNNVWSTMRSSDGFGGIGVGNWGSSSNCPLFIDSPKANGGNWSSERMINNVSFADNTLNQWVHYALTRKGDTVYGFKNGTRTFAKELPKGAAIGNAANRFRLGSHCMEPKNYYFTGYIDEFRVIKGEALWTSSFTPPTQYQTASSGSSGTSASSSDACLTYTMESGDSIKFGVSNMPSSDVTWTSSNPSVVKVSAKGKLTAVREGSATITAKSGSVTVKIKIKVED